VVLQLYFRSTVVVAASGHVDAGCVGFHELRMTIFDPKRQSLAQNANFLFKNADTSSE
jgi:hypothetical protein